MYSLKETKSSFEDMFLEIAENNKIGKYNFVFYVSSESENYGIAKFTEPIILRGEVKTTIKNELPVQSNYFNNKSLEDLEADLFKAVEDEYDQILGSVGVSSVVGLKNERRKYHMKHIDFMCSVTDENVEKIRRELKDIKSGNGWLVMSGNSYHFHGLDVLPYREWRNWMKKLKNQVEKDVNDRDVIFGEKEPTTTLDLDWPYIQWARNFSILRVMSSVFKKEPRIIFEIKD